MSDTIAAQTMSQTPGCPLCGGALARTEQVREMMFGLRDDFTYGICSVCQASHLLEVPADLSPFYPPGYLSFVAKVPTLPRNPIKRRLAILRNRHEVFGDSLAGKFLMRLTGPGGQTHEAKAFAGFIQSHANRSMRTMRIVDVGCGNAALLAQMALAGCRHLTGVDPFLPDSVQAPYGVTLRKCQLAQLPDDSADLIVMNHCLEHMDDQHGVFADLRRILSAGGFARIEIPIIEGRPYEQFGVNWGDYDAPRHLYLHTTTSMGIMAQKHGLKVCDVQRHTLASVLARSEMYRRDTPWFDPRTGKYRPYDTLLSPDELASFDSQAHESTQAGQGGRGVFWLQRLA